MFLLQRRLLMTTSVAALSAATVAVSDAETLAGSETDALAIVYTDDHFKATTGFNGSVYCLDSGTPANDYDSSPTTEAASYLTYTSPSPKMILHDDGVLKYAAHNIWKQSEAINATGWVPSGAARNVDGFYGDDATTKLKTVYQAHDLVVGATYRMSFEAKNVSHQFVQLLCLSTATPGFVNFDLTNGTSNATTMTGVTMTDVGDGWYRCTALFVASQVTINPGFSIADSLSEARAGASPSEGVVGLRKVHLHRYPADTTYLKTTSSARYADPIEFNSSGTALGLLVEPQRTNLLTYSSDLTNAAWTKSNMTTAKTATGPGSVANQATTCTATAGNATALQAITSSSAQRVTSVWLKRRTGTGNIDLTQDNGSTWTTVAVDSNWTSFAIAAVTSANPTVGLRIVTSGDAVDVAFFQHELGSSATSPIETYGSTVTRAIDNVLKPTSGFAHSNATATYYAKIANYVDGNQYGIYASDGNINERIVLLVNGGAYNAVVTDGGVAQASISGGTAADPARLAVAVAANDVALVAGGAVIGSDASATMPTITEIGIATHSVFPVPGYNGPVHVQEILILPRRVSNADMQTLTSTGALP